MRITTLDKIIIDDELVVIPIRVIWGLYSFGEYYYTQIYTWID